MRIWGRARRIWRVACPVVLAFLLLLLIGTVVLGIRSYWINDSFGGTRRSYPGTREEMDEGGVSFGSGWMQVSWGKIVIWDGGPWSEPAYSQFGHQSLPVYPPYQPSKDDVVLPGLRWRRMHIQTPKSSVNRATHDRSTVWLHLSWVVTVFTALTVLTGADWWRHRRNRSPDTCHNCGYCLTGNISGVCPECGTAVEMSSGSIRS